MSEQNTAVSAPRPGRSLLRRGLPVFLAVLVAVLAFRLFWEADSDQPDVGPGRYVPVSLTAEQKEKLPAWGEKIARLLSCDLGEDLSRLHDIQAIVARTLEGTDGEEVSRSMDRIVKSAVTHRAGGIVASAVGSPAHFLRVCTRAGLPAVTLRVQYGEAQYAYLDLLVQPGGGEFKIVDVYDYFTGTCRTEDFRCVMVPVLLGRDAPVVSQWLENWHMQKKDAQYLVSLLAARGRSMDEDVLTLCDQAPESMRNNRFVFFTRCTALQQLMLTNPRYEKVYFATLQDPPPMPDSPHVLGLLLLPKLMAAGDAQMADDVVEQAMNVIGEDAYLMLLRARIRLRLGDVDGARAWLRRAKEREPTLNLLQHFERVDLPVLGPAGC